MSWSSGRLGGERYPSSWWHREDIRRKRLVSLQTPFWIWAERVWLMESSMMDGIISKTIDWTISWTIDWTIIRTIVHPISRTIGMKLWWVCVLCNINSKYWDEGFDSGFVYMFYLRYINFVCSLNLRDFMQSFFAQIKNIDNNESLGRGTGRLYLSFIQVTF